MRTEKLAKRLGAILERFRATNQGKQWQDMTDLAIAADDYRRAKSDLEAARQIPWGGGEVGCLPPTVGPAESQMAARNKIREIGARIRQRRQAQ